MRGELQLGFLVVGLSILCSGCQFDKLDLTELECPCGQGFTCDELRGICVEGFLRPDRPMDVAVVLDAGSEDSGAVDSAPNDVGTDISFDSAMDSDAPDLRSYCERADAATLFCDGFESPALMGSTLGMGSVVRDVTQTFRGEGSLRSSSSGMGVVGYLSTADNDWTEFTNLHLQFRLFVVSDPPVTSVSVLSLFGSLGESIGVTLERDGGIGLAVLESFPSTAAYTFPRDTWVCVRLVLNVATDGSIELFVDDETLLTERAVDFTQLGAPSSFGLGITYTGPDHGPVIMRHDEVLLSATPLSCAD